MKPLNVSEQQWFTCNIAELYGKMKITPWKIRAYTTFIFIHYLSQQCQKTANE